MLLLCKCNLIFNTKKTKEANYHYNVYRMRYEPVYFICPSCARSVPNPFITLVDTQDDRN